MVDGTERRNTVQAVERALDLLVILAQQGKPLSVTEAASLAGLKLSTTHRLLNTMLLKGFVEQDPGTSRYKLGVAAIRLGGAAVEHMDIHSITRPYLEKLAAATEETVNLAVLDGGEVVYIDQIPSTRMIIVNMFARVGNRGPAYCTGSGKALLATLPDEELNEIIDHLEFMKFTNETIDNADMLRREIEKIRRDGYALDLGERDEGVRCVAAPIMNRFGRAEAAISVAGPSHRLTNFYLNHELIQLVKNTAMAITQRLGGTPLGGEPALAQGQK